MTISPIEDSPVPGQSHSHVHGPQQSPVDPVAAGLSDFVRPEAISESHALPITTEGARAVDVQGTVEDATQNVQTPATELKADEPAQPPGEGTGTVQAPTDQPS